MKRKLKVTYQNRTGIVEYDSDNLTDFKVFLSPADKKKEVIAHLTTKRTYFNPQSQKIDDYEEVEAMPTDNLDYFERALCTLHSKTGVWVHWDAE